MMYWVLFYKFLLVGLFSFGGGYTAIALIKESLNGFTEIGEGLISDLIAISEMTPGPVAVNLATFIGTRTMGGIGALVATFAICFPAFLIIILYSKYLKKYETSPLIKSVYTTVRPACFAIILSVGVALLVENLGIVDFLEKGIINAKLMIILVIIALMDLIYGIVKKRNLPTIPLILVGGFLGFIMASLEKI